MYQENRRKMWKRYLYHDSMLKNITQKKYTSELYFYKMYYFEFLFTVET